jgi:LCP family protein required for cell wall assembly
MLCTGPSLLLGARSAGGGGGGARSASVGVKGAGSGLTTGAGLAAAALPVAAGNPFGANLVHLVVVGTAVGGPEQCADAVYLAVADLARQRLGLVAIPRETRVALGDQGSGQLGGAFALRAGRALVCQAVADLTGAEVHHFARLDLAALQAAVDTLGGVRLNVEAPLRYRDQAQDLTIALEAGEQRLDGARVGDYVRFKADARGEHGRRERQTRFLLAAARGLGQPERLALLPKLAQALVDSGETTLNGPQMLALAQLAARAARDGLVTLTLPGRYGQVGAAWCYQADASGADLAARLAATLAAGPLPPVVTVYNASDRLGLDQQVVKRLQAAGVEAVAAPEPAAQRKTTSVCELDSPAAAQRVADLLGVQAEPCAAPPDCPGLTPAGTAGAAVVVVVGSDYRGR